MKQETTFHENTKKEKFKSKWNTYAWLGWSSLSVWSLGSLSAPAPHLLELQKKNEMKKKFPNFNIKTSKQQQQKDRKNKKVNNLKTPEGSAFVTIVRDHIHETFVKRHVMQMDWNRREKIQNSNREASTRDGRTRLRRSVVAVQKHRRPFLFVCVRTWRRV